MRKILYKILVKNMPLSYTRKARGGGKGVWFSTLLTGKEPANPHTYSGKKPTTLQSKKSKSVLKMLGFNPNRSRNAVNATRKINKLGRKIEKIRTIISNPSALKTLSHKASKKYENIKLELSKIEENANRAIDQEEDPKKAGILRRKLKANQSEVISIRIKPRLNDLKKQLYTYMAMQRNALRRLYLQKLATSKRLHYTRRQPHKP